MGLAVQGIASAYVAAIRAGAPDANGQAAVVRTAEGGANPCRHCLGLIREGERKLVFAYRPFGHLQPYAEVGPVFLHEGACERYDSDRLPSWFAYLQPAIIRGYGHDDWILYETGAVVCGNELTAASEEILRSPEVAYVHIRSKYNCFQCRVDRRQPDNRADPVVRST